MSKNVKIRKGVNIKLIGEADRVLANAGTSETYAIKPTDFHGLVPKMLVKVGDDVKAGQIIFQDKYNEKIKFTAPVSGEIAEIVRGAKRRILEVRILADKEVQYAEATTVDVNSASGDQIKEALLNAGLWPFIRQRPYSVIANPDDKPKSIFISAFDSSPLAADDDFIVHGQGNEFQAGLDAIAKLTDGKLHLNINAKAKASDVFNKSKNVQINRISGPHPAGNVGVQIHHIDPINKGEKVWYLAPQDVLTIGKFFQTGKVDMSRIVAVAGSMVQKPKYYRTIIGTNAKALLAEGLNEGDHRIISGNVLSGERVGEDGYLGFYDSTLSVIPENAEPEFFGWLAPGFKKFSISRTFPSWLMPSKSYNLDTHMHGEDRAFVVTGQYDSVFPMDVYPMQLVKAIMTGNIEAMENLGIYEVAPEDFALCEVVCTSKVEVQRIVREGLDLVQTECG